MIGCGYIGRCHIICTITSRTSSGIGARARIRTGINQAVRRIGIGIQDRTTILQACKTLLCCCKILLLLLKLQFGNIQLHIHKGHIKGNQLISRLHLVSLAYKNILNDHVLVHRDSLGGIGINISA